MPKSTSDNKAQTVLHTLGAMAASCLLAATLSSCDALQAFTASGTDAANNLFLSLTDRDIMADSTDTDNIQATGKEAALEVFTRAATACETSVEIGRSLLITQEDLTQAIEELRFTPEYLCSTGTFSFEMMAPTEEDDYYASSLTLTYDFDPAVIPTYRAQMKAVATQVVSQIITPGMSDYDKALALHDWLVENCEYDTTQTRYSTYDALVGHSATCQGYCQAYRMLLEMAGVPCDYASSIDMDHRWNMVAIDGTWYHVDVTWDDPVIEEGYVLDETLHTHFLKSDETWAELGYYNWTAEHTAPVDYPE